MDLEIPIEMPKHCGLCLFSMTADSECGGWHRWYCYLAKALDGRDVRVLSTGHYTCETRHAECPLKYKTYPLNDAMTDAITGAMFAFINNLNEAKLKARAIKKEREAIRKAAEAAEAAETANKKKETGIFDESCS